MSKFEDKAWGYCAFVYTVLFLVLVYCMTGLFR
jgi:hypothetical protein